MTSSCRSFTARTPLYPARRPPRPSCESVSTYSRRTCRLCDRARPRPVVSDCRQLRLHGPVVFRGRRKAFLRRWTTRHASVQVGVVSRLTGQKGINLMKHAMVKALERGSQVRRRCSTQGDGNSLSLRSKLFLWFGNACNRSHALRQRLHQQPTSRTALTWLCLPASRASGGSSGQCARPESPGGV